MAGNNLGTAQGRIQIDTSGLREADLALRSAGQGMLNFGIQAVGAFAAIVGTAAKFEKEMDFVQAVTNATAEEMKALEAAALDLGTKSIFGPVALSQAFVELAKAGASVKDIIDGVGAAAVNLATAADVEIPFAGENLINILNTFKLGAEDATRVADLLAGAANASSVSLQDLVVTFKYAGPVAEGLGISIEEVTDAISLLGQVGIKGSTAGTSLRQIMLNLSPPTEKAATRMKELGIITADGANQFFDAEGKAKSLAEVFDILGKSLEGATQQQKTEALRDLFGVRAIPAALELMSQGEEGFRNMNAEINRTTAADVAAKRMDNLDGAIKRLKATLEAAMVEGGNPFLDGLKEMIQALTSLIIFFNNLPGPIKTFIIGAIGMIGVLSIMSGVFLLTIGNIVRAIRVFGELGNAARVIGPGINAMTGAIRALSVALLTSPIFWIAVAIIAVAAAFYLLYTRVEGFRDAIDSLWQNMQAAWDGITKGFTDLWNAAREFFRGWEKAWDSFQQAFSNQGITTGLDSINGWIERIGNAFGDAWRSAGAFFRTIGSGIKGFTGAITGGLTNGLNAMTEFFTSLPATIGRGLVSGLSAFGAALVQLPAKLLYALGFALGRSIRWSAQLTKLFFETGVKVVTAFIKALLKLPGLIFNVLRTALTYFVKFHVEAAKLGIRIGQALFNGIVDFIVKLPGRIVGLFNATLDGIVTLVPAFSGAAWDLGTGVSSTLWDILSAIPGFVFSIFTEALSTLYSMVTTFGTVAWKIGSAVFNGIIDFFVSLPGRIVGLLWDAVNAIGGMVGTFFDKAKAIGSNLWNGFRDGLFGSPHTKIEYAMWDMEANMSKSMSSLQRNIRTIQGMEKRMPQLNAGLVGLPSAGEAAVNAKGGGNVWQQNAPLIGEAVIRDDRDIVTLARQIDDIRAQRERARGRTLVGAGT